MSVNRKELRYYWYKIDNKTIWYSSNKNDVPTDAGVIFLGNSDAPKPKMGAAYLAKLKNIGSGYNLKAIS